MTSHPVSDHQPPSANPDPTSTTLADITIVCPRCGHRPDGYQPRCSRCDADLAELFSATYRLRPAPWARWVAWAILAAILAMVGLALVAILLAATSQTTP